MNTLEIAHCSVPDQGKYACVIENDQGEISHESDIVSDEGYIEDNEAELYIAGESHSNMKTILHTAIQYVLLTRLGISIVSTKC